MFPYLQEGNTFFVIVLSKFRSIKGCVLPWKRPPRCCGHLPWDPQALLPTGRPVPGSVPENTEASPMHPEPGKECRVTGLHSQFSTSQEAAITFTLGMKHMSYLVFDHPTVDSDMVLVFEGSPEPTVDRLSVSCLQHQATCPAKPMRLISSGTLA